MKDFGLLKLCLALLTGLSLMPSVAQSHESGTVELTVDSSNRILRAELDILDLDFLIGIRIAGSGELTTGDVQRAAPAIRNYVFDNLQVAECELAHGDSRVGIRSTAQPRVVVDLDLQCVESHAVLNISSQLFAELPDYRTVVGVAKGDSVTLQVMNNGTAKVSLYVGESGSGFASFVVEGIVHILHGADHLVFLLLLVLPMAGRGSLKHRFLSVAGIVTAFTISHSITLGLSTLGNLYLPSGPVEILIAASIVLVALMNLSGRFEKLAWPVAYNFGLIHGFGFAGAFSELASGASLGWTDLLAFNLGVELGQMAVIAASLLLLCLLEPRRRLSRNLVPAGSIVAGCIGLMWIVDRV